MPGPSNILPWEEWDLWWCYFAFAPSTQFQLHLFGSVPRSKLKDGDQPAGSLQGSALRINTHGVWRKSLGAGGPRRWGLTLGQVVLAENLQLPILPAAGGMSDSVLKGGSWGIQILPIISTNAGIRSAPTIHRLENLPITYSQLSVSAVRIHGFSQPGWCSTGWEGGP